MVGSLQRSQPTIKERHRDRRLEKLTLYDVLYRAAQLVTVAAGEAPAGQGGGRGGTGAGGAFDLERAAVLFDDHLGERQAEPGAFLAGLDIPQLAERLERDRDLLGADADAVVAYRDFNIAAAGVAQHDFDAAVVARKLHRVL